MDREINHVYLYPVVDITDGESGDKDIVWLDPSEFIQKVETGGKKPPVIHIENRRYRPLWTVEHFAKAWEPFGFELLERNNVVNMRKIKHFNKVRGLAYFDDEMKCSADVARVYEDVVEGVLNGQAKVRTKDIQDSQIYNYDTKQVENLEKSPVKLKFKMGFV